MAGGAQDGMWRTVRSVLVVRFARRVTVDAGDVAAATRAAALRRIRSRALVIGLSVTPFGVSFGAVSVATGLSVLQTCLLSLVLFSGASQFALVSVLGAGGAVGSALATALLLGSRNALYGAGVRGLLRAPAWLRPLAAQVTIDESTAMAFAEAPSGFSAYAFWATALSVYVLWNLATLIGAVVGRGLGSLSAAGLDAAGPAAFVALLGPRLRVASARWVALLAAAVAVLCVPVLPVGSPVLVGGGVAALSAVWVWRR
jgi:predicted branched-subunit amino acid permease